MMAHARGMLNNSMSNVTTPNGGVKMLNKDPTLNANRDNVTYAQRMASKGVVLTKAEAL